MKKQNRFLALCTCLLMAVCFGLINSFFDFIKTMAENGILNKYMIALTALIMLFIGWIGVYIGIKSSKHNKTKTKNNIIPVFVYFVFVESVYITFDVMRYSLEHNLLNIYYFFGIGLTLMFIGWTSNKTNNIQSSTK
ncbi:MAG: hypothetical protein ACLRFM_02315, partial [Alphaproteobacteria bacterium]